MLRSHIYLLFISALLAGAVACATPPASASSLRVLATTTFLADMAQNVAGTRAHVDALMPVGVDPHSFEATPADVRRVADSTVLIENGAGFEEFLSKLLQNAGGKRQIITASKGLTSRQPRAGEPSDADNPIDPHFWLDPNNAIVYVENLRDGLSQADPDGKAIYAANAATYIAQLKELDAWIRAQVQTIPVEHRLLVTNHESLGYFADRYGFKIVGAIIPSISTSASPSAEQLAKLIDQMKQTGARAVFIESGNNPQLANQIARDAGINIVTQLYTHSTSDAQGPAPTYIDMLKYDVNAIVKALK
jgi:ABC-type Zn uptake system ZnuABC Zn-binding protein ZnuA